MDTTGRADVEPPVLTPAIVDVGKQHGGIRMAFNQLCDSASAKIFQYMRQLQTVFLSVLIQAVVDVTEFTQKLAEFIWQHWTCYRTGKTSINKI